MHELHLSCCCRRRCQRLTQECRQMKGHSFHKPSFSLPAKSRSFSSSECLVLFFCVHETPGERKISSLSLFTQLGKHRQERHSQSQPLFSLCCCFLTPVMMEKERNISSCLAHSLLAWTQKDACSASENNGRSVKHTSKTQ